MKAATAYAKVASKDNPIYAKLTKGKAKNAYNIAIGDWFKAPVIRRIEWDEGHIRVLASDDVRVTRVRVTILGEAGQRLEQADADLKVGLGWEYQAANKGLVRVEAWDFAGNVTRQEFSPSRFQSVWEETGRR